MTDAEIKAQLLSTLAQKAGYKIGHVDPIGKNSIVAELLHDSDFDTANLVAAWYGLLSRSPRNLVFHEHDDGPDVLHTWTTQARPANVRQAAKDLPHFQISDAGRCYAFDSGKKNTAKILTLSRLTRGSDHEAFLGTGQIMGGTGGPDSASRISYRNVISGYSRES